MAQKHIPSLNGLRALSIIMVICSHFYRHNFFSDNFLVRYVKLWVFNGALGVNVFFIISGFLITTLLISERENYGKISLKNFYLRRTIRIFPAYYFLLLVYFILQLFGLLHLSARNWLSDITYTKQFFPDSDNETGHLWSLSVEEIFYLIWPIVFIKSKSNSIKIILFLITVITTARIFQYNYPIPKYVSTIYSTGDALLVGCLFAINYDEIVGFVGKMKNWNLLLFPAIIVSVFIFAHLYYLSSAEPQTKTSSNLNAMQALSYSLLGNIGLFTNLLIGLIIVYSINIKSLWSGFLNLPFMEYIGKLSYSIYLWQQLFTQDKSFFHKMPLLILVSFIFLSACFSYYIIEKPFLQLKKRFATFK
jgi:peptidoglycan/LPS O-acetylase OafA/YrhL